MVNTKKTAALSIILIAILASAAFALSPEEIIRKLEANLMYPSSRSSGRIIITDRFGERQSSYISYTSGTDKSMVELTGKEEAGQKILRLKDEIYLYYPDAEEIIRLQGSALKQRVLGSDMSYEDMAGDRSILDSYTVYLEGEEKVSGKECYKVILKARTRNVAYQNQILWIDKQTFMYKKIHQIAKSGKVLKELTVIKTKKISSYIIPVEILIKDMLKKSSSTRFIVDSFETDPVIPAGTFDIQALW